MDNVRKEVRGGETSPPSHPPSNEIVANGTIGVAQPGNMRGNRTNASAPRRSPRSNIPATVSTPAITVLSRLAAGESQLTSPGPASSASASQTLNRNASKVHSTSQLPRTPPCNAMVDTASSHTTPTDLSQALAPVLIDAPEVEETHPPVTNHGLLL